MLGILLGGSVAVGLVSSVWTHSLATDFGSPDQLALLAIGMAVGAVLLGLIFRMTIGVTAMVWMLGAALAAVLSLFNGEIVYTGPLLPHVFVVWVVQQMLGGPERRAAGVEF